MIGAYRGTENFAYPGWRLTVPGGPAGGHYKGFTHSYAAGTTLAPQDDYEATRDQGLAAHDTVHIHPNAPRGVYRGPAEVPPRANASGQAMTYRGMQTRRHAGTSVAPGSFPAEFYETGEDAFIGGGPSSLEGLEAIVVRGDGGLAVHEPPIYPPIYHGPVVALPHNAPMPPIAYPVSGPIVSAPDLPMCPANDPFGMTQACLAALNSPCPPCRPRSGATNTVTQPPPFRPLPINVTVPITAVPISPAPAPSVPTHALVPIPDGSGNFYDSSDGTIVPAGDVTVNASGQASYKPGAQPSAVSWAGMMNWLGQNTIFSAFPNYAVLGGGALLATMLLGRKSAHR